MRKVLIKKWNTEERLYEEGKYRTKPGTRCWEEGHTHEGLFHQWGSKYEEFENGPGNYTVAIVEFPDGTVEEVLIINLKFVK